MTGSSELTHANGLASGPVQAQETLESFPRELKVVSLCLSLIAQRSSFNKLVNDVYLFMKDRYFIGEVLEACLEGKSWYNCTILQVRGPTEQEIKDYQDSGVGSAEDDQIFPPACLYHYQVEKFCSYNDINRVFEASASHVRRKKRLITKGKLTLFLKQCLSLNSFGIWSIQDSIQESLGINGVKFSDIFVGQPPKFPKKYEKIAKKAKKDSPDQNGGNGIVVKKESVKKIKAAKPPRVANSFNSNESSDADDFKNSSWQVTDINSSGSSQKNVTGKSSKTESKHSTKIVKAKKKGNSDGNQKLDQSVKRKYSTWRGLTWEERQKIKEKKKKRALMEKLKKREEKMKEKAKRDEEKLQLATLLKGRTKTREDLECDDLRPLPVPKEVKCAYIPNELFGDFMVILEFFQSFQTLAEMKKSFPRGVTFNYLENALRDCNIDGPLCNIVIYLLSTLFNMKDENEILDSDAPIDFENDELVGDADVSETARLAAAEYGNRLYQGAFVSETLNHLTVTEVLRLHLSCGSRRAELASQNCDFQADPGDPTTVLRTKHPHILRALSSCHVCEMPLQDKIIILTCLIDQILTCVPVREELDERGEQLKQVKLEIRAYKAAEVKRNKEAHAQRIKEKREAKMKLKEGDTSQSAVAPEPDVPAKSDEKITFEKELRSNEKKTDLEEKINRLRSLSMNFNLFPIGRDRAHRRFWVFSSLPGLYVENNPFEIGPCLLQATPRGILSPSRVQSSKEAKSPGRKNASKSPVKREGNDGSLRTNNVKLESSEVESVRLEMWQCTSSDSCPVHGLSAPRVRWSYFERKDDVRLLIDRLNKCAFRESELRKILIRDEQWLKDKVEQCPMDIVNSLETENEPKPVSSSRYRYLNCPPGTSASCLMELVLRERILDLENKISSRCMGSLEVNDTAAWREAIEKGEYDKQCDKLMWGFSNDQIENDELKVFNNEEFNHTRIVSDTVNSVCDSSVAQNCVQDIDTQGSALRRNSPVKSWDVSGRVLEEKNGENRRTSCHDLNNKSQGEVVKKSIEIISKVKDEFSRSRTIKNLASAILQLAQAVDVSYLRNPLVDDDDEDQKIMNLKGWEVSLMNSTSFSQLFLHISLLDFSIHWSKSVLNTRCALCKRRGDGENMLLCDGCNRGHHLYCLKPKLTKVPEGDWFCMKCKPEQKQESSEKKRKSSSENVTKEYEKRPSKSRKIMHNDVCNACGLKYNLILCSSCPLAFHIECVSPPLKKAPEGMWTCSECNVNEDTTEEKENETSRRSSRRKSGATDFSLNNSVLQDLLSDIMCQRDAWPFLQPVRKAEAPRYHIIIKKPMDLGTMKYKLNRAQYKNSSEFVADALLVFENCRMYNDEDTEVYKCGSRLSQYFKKRCKELGLDLRD
ncbi:Nucleosome-remodeling factor subunit NURF301 [Gryllus bimaculatus]|nr:Nucleosome-remodeling factor subunit NURF301 [Gryllus bimaculatus]